MGGEDWKRPSAPLIEGPSSSQQILLTETETETEAKAEAETGIESMKEFPRVVISRAASYESVQRTVARVETSRGTPGDCLYQNTDVADAAPKIALKVVQSGARGRKEIDFLKVSFPTTELRPPPPGSIKSSVPLTFCAEIHRASRVLMLCAMTRAWQHPDDDRRAIWGEARMDHDGERSQWVRQASNRCETPTPLLHLPFLHSSPPRLLPCSIGLFSSWSVQDIKIGTRTYGVEASPAKIDEQTQKAMQVTAERWGGRVRWRSEHARIDRSATDRCAHAQ
eukprot:763462-Hanusia_phi.AAC.3